MFVKKINSTATCHKQVWKTRQKPLNSLLPVYPAQKFHYFKSHVHVHMFKQPFMTGFSSEVSRLSWTSDWLESLSTSDPVSVPERPESTTNSASSNFSTLIMSLLGDLTACGGFVFGRGRQHEKCSPSRLGPVAGTLLTLVLQVTLGMVFCERFQFFI